MCLKIVVEYKTPLVQFLNKSIQKDFITLKPKQVFVFLYGTVVVSMVTTEREVDPKHFFTF